MYYDVRVMRIYLNLAKNQIYFCVSSACSNQFHLHPHKDKSKFSYTATYFPDYAKLLLCKYIQIKFYKIYCFVYVLLCF